MWAIVNRVHQWAEPKAPTYLEELEYMGLSDVIAKELENARSVCSEYGEGDPHCRAAWDAVEEVLAARSHQPTTLNSLEQHCAENPDAVECRVYDN